MEENVLIAMLAVDIPKWKKLVAAIEKEELIQGEDKLFISLRDFWKKNNFAPDKCKQLLNEIATYKNKHPASDLKENLMEFRGLCSKYYTKERDVFEAFQKALGGTRSPEQSPQPQPRPRPQPQPYPEPKPKPRTEEYNHPKKKSKKWILALFIIIAAYFLLPIIIRSLIENNRTDYPFIVLPTDIEEYQSQSSSTPVTTSSESRMVNESRYAIKRAYFYNEPNVNSRRNSSLAEGDVTLITKVQNDFGYTVFTNARGQTTEGWLKMDEMRLNNAWGKWTIKPENDEMGFGLPTILLFEDGTAHYYMSDDWSAEGRYTFNGNVVSFTGKPCGDNAWGDEPDEQESFTIRGNSLISTTSSWVVLIKRDELPIKLENYYINNYPNLSLNNQKNEMSETTQSPKEVQSQNTTAEKGVIINGIRWATRNVDAPGTFVDNPEDAGMFYQWNRRIGWSSTDPMVASDGSTKWDESSASGTTWEKSNDPCPVGWRVPTFDEIKTLFDENKVSSEWTTVNGVRGLLFGNNDNSIFLPAAGYRDSDRSGAIHGIGGNYWSNTHRKGNYAYILAFSRMDGCHIACALNVRCVCISE